jgi:hypothetical protein
VIYFLFGDFTFPLTLTVCSLLGMSASRCEMYTAWPLAVLILGALGVSYLVGKYRGRSRINIKAILRDPVQRRALLVRAIYSTQALEDLTMTMEIARLLLAGWSACGVAVTLRHDMLFFRRAEGDEGRDPGGTPRPHATTRREGREEGRPRSDGGVDS